MATYEYAAIVQWGCAVIFAVLATVATRLDRWTLMLLSWALSLLFLRVGFVNWGRIHGESDIARWASRPDVILIHSGVIGLLTIGIVVELVIREWGTNGR
jgi:hypothetical protein